jgi:hypothetical protein
MTCEVGSSPARRPREFGAPMSRAFRAVLAHAADAARLRAEIAVSERGTWVAMDLGDRSVRGRGRLVT